MLKHLLFGLLCLISTVSVSLAQDRTISGKVLSGEDNSPLPGVNIIVKGTTRGASSDASGNYSLSIPNDATALTFSFIGFKSTDVQIGSRSTINVTMQPDASTLQEVVVTALGITREKKSLGYATQELKGADVSTVKESNFLNSLSGKVSGVEIRRNNNLGASTNVVIRGFKSLTGNNQALFVVDGVPIDNSNTNSSAQQRGAGGYDFGNAASDINPDDIESINVLKGAAATALYGSRAANGVVMVTTKKGALNKGLGVTVSAGYTVGSIDPTTFPKYQNQYGAGYGAFYDTPYFFQTDINGDGKPDLVVPTTEDASYGGKFDPSLQVYNWTSFDPSSPNYGKPQPWVMAANGPRSFFQNSQTFNGNVSLDGGNEKGSYRASYTRFDQKGILPNSKLQKNTVAFNGSYNFSNKFSASSSINFIRQDGLGRYSNGYNDNIMTNFRQWWETNVDLKDLEDAYNRTGINRTWNMSDPIAGDLRPIYWDNPYFQRYKSYESDWRNRIFGNATLNYKINDWIDVLGRVSLDTYSEQQEQRVAVGSINNSGVPQYSRFDHTFSENNYDLIANFHKDIAPNLNLTGLVGVNIRRTNDSRISSVTNGGLVVPELYSLANSKNPISPPTERQYEIYQEGLFANVSLGYKDYLFLDLTGRRDRSSTLPLNNNVYYYPSISGSFVFSNVLSKTTWLDFGKLRLNYAEVGNFAPALSLYDIYTTPTNIVSADPTQAFGSATLFTTNTTKNNPDLKNERTKSMEAGLEMQFLKKRLGFDMAVYKTNSVNQIMPVTLSRATGYNARYVNAGDIRNQGIELSLYGFPVKTADFSWRVGVNWTRNRNKVISLYSTAAGDTVKNLVLGSFQQGVTSNAAIGQPYGILQGTDYVYMNGQRRIATNASGAPTGYYAITPTTNNPIGNINPDWRMGITNAFTFKALTLSFLIDIQKGGSVFSLDRAYGLATGLYPETVFNNDLGNPVRNSLADGGGVILPGVLPDGTPNNIRVNAQSYGLFGYVRNPNKAFIYDASYVKLREVAFSYKLPSSLFGGNKAVKDVTLSLVGRNLWIIHKNLPYADPEDGFSSGNLQGYQGGSYPAVREVGVNLKFSL